MKNLKYLIFAILFVGSVDVNAQAFSSYGHTPYAFRQVTCKTPANVTKIQLYDTLTDVDTGYLQFSTPNGGSIVASLTMTKLTGTQAGTAVLMGSNLQSMPSPTDASWRIITGSVVYVAGGWGASATVTGTGTTYYQCHLPAVGNDFANYQVRIITSGTVTTVYSMNVGNKY